MNTLFEKLNLRPQERRLVMVAGVIVFVVVNLWFVVPHFGDWKQALQKQQTAEKTALAYEELIRKTPDLQARLEELKSSGNVIPPDEASLDLMRTIQTEAASANVFLQRMNPAGGGTIANNPFFDEQRVTVSLVAGEGELVNFLRRLGQDNSLIRVRDLDLKPDASGQKLSGNLTIVGNYQKKPGGKPTPRQGPLGGRPTS